MNSLSGDLTVAATVRGTSVDLNVANSVTSAPLGDAALHGMYADELTRLGIRLLLAPALLLLVGRGLKENDTAV